MFSIKSPREIQKIKDAGKIVAEILHVLLEETQEGMTTDDLDRRAHELTLK